MLVVHVDIVAIYGSRASEATKNRRDCTARHGSFHDQLQSRERQVTNNHYNGHHGDDEHAGDHDDDDEIVHLSVDGVSISASNQYLDYVYRSSNEQFEPLCLYAFVAETCVAAPSIWPPCLPYRLVDQSRGRRRERVATRQQISTNFFLTLSGSQPNPGAPELCSEPPG